LKRSWDGGQTRPSSEQLIVFFQGADSWILTDERVYTGPMTLDISDLANVCNAVVLFAPNKNEPLDVSERDVSNPCC